MRLVQQELQLPELREQQVRQARLAQWGQQVPQGRALQGQQGQTMLRERRAQQARMERLPLQVRWGRSAPKGL